MEILPQILTYSLIASAVYALIATGLTLTFGTLEFINFAHGDMATSGAFIFYSLYILAGLALIPSLILTVLAAALLGMFIERTTFRPVRDRQEFLPLILSIGVQIVVISIIVMIFGAGSQNYYQPGDIASTYRFWNDSVVITKAQIAIIISSFTALTGLYLFLKYTRSGKAIRAVSDNKEIASTMGIDVNKKISLIFAIATAFAGFAGILIAFDQNLYPTMGVLLGIKAFAVIVMGGVGSFKGAILGALIIGFSENIIVGLTPISSSYKETIVFVIFILILLIKPYGIYGGRKQEVESR